MIGDQQHGAVALHGFLIESAEAEPCAEHAAHQLEKNRLAQIFIAGQTLLETRP